MNTSVRSRSPWSSAQLHHHEYIDDVAEYPMYRRVQRRVGAIIHVGSAWHEHAGKFPNPRLYGLKSRVRKCLQCKNLVRPITRAYSIFFTLPNRKSGWILRRHWLDLPSPIYIRATYTLHRFMLLMQKDDRTRPYCQPPCYDCPRSNWHRKRVSGGRSYLWLKMDTETVHAAHQSHFSRMSKLCEFVFVSNDSIHVGSEAERDKFDEFTLIKRIDNINNDAAVKGKKREILNFLTEIFTTDKLPHFHLILILITVLSYHNEPKLFRPAVFREKYARPSVCARSTVDERQRRRSASK